MSLVIIFLGLLNYCGNFSLDDIHMNRKYFSLERASGESVSLIAGGKNIEGERGQ